MQSVNVRCVTLGEEILPLLETAGRSFGRRLSVPLAGGLAMDPTAVGETAKVAARLQRTTRFYLSLFLINARDQRHGSFLRRCSQTQGPR